MTHAFEAKLAVQPTSYTSICALSLNEGQADYACMALTVAVGQHMSQFIYISGHGYSLNKQINPPLGICHGVCQSHDQCLYASSQTLYVGGGLRWLFLCL